MWPVHEEYMARVAKLLMFDVEVSSDHKAGRLQNMAQAPALWLAPEQEGVYENRGPLKGDPQ